MTSEYILSEIAKTKGTDKKHLIYALGSINDDNAEEYYSRLLKKAGSHLHFLCHCPCRCVSDLAADELEKAVDKLIPLDALILPQDMNDILWSTLNLAAFKDSERLFEVLEKIGSSCDKIRHYSFDMHYLIFSKCIKPFLSKRAHKWWAYECESNFINALNDMLICSITRLGNDFADKIISLGEKYCECYGRAAFFAEFVRDNKAAYDKFACAENYDIILSTMDGLSCHGTDEYYVYSPYWFMDNTNKLYHSRISIGRLDVRWTEYLVKLSENEKAVCSHYLTSYEYKALSYKRMSRMMLEIFDPSDSVQKKIFKPYFEKYAPLYANEADIHGLELCSDFDRLTLIVEILKNISAGKCNKYVLYHAIEGMKLGRRDRRRLIENVEKYIDENYINDPRIMDAFLSLVMQYS